MVPTPNQNRVKKEKKTLILIFYQMFREDSDFEDYLVLNNVVKRHMD